MENAIYAALPRQVGLMKELHAIANNIANISTTGFRREGVIFAEHIRALGPEPSLSLAHASARHIDLSQGEMVQTGGEYDFAIRGEGFFRIATPQGDFLSRAGHFMPNSAGEIVTPEGHFLLDEGGGPIQLPIGGGGTLALGADGSLSLNGQPIARVGLWQPNDPHSLTHHSGTLFKADDSLPFEEGSIIQGYLEGSNVSPIQEIARMIEVQRHYELGQSLLDQEDKRIRNVISTLGR